MIDEYIKELIATNNRVIIPNFGAFLLRATSKNKNKKDLASKVDDIYFSPFLKFNDELLVNHIIKKEGTDQQKALEKINEYIKQIEEKVKKDGIYTIEGLGEFTQDNQGKIQFKVVTETPKTSKTKEEKPTTKKAAEKKKTPPKTIHEKAAASKKTTPKSSTEKKKEVEEKKEEEKKTTAPQSKEKAQKTPPPPPPKPPKGKTPSKSGSNRGLVLSIAIGLPIVVLFIWAMLNFDSVQKLFDSKDKQVSEQVENEKPSKEDKARDKEETGEEGEEEKEEKGEDTEKSREEQQQETEDKIIEEKRKEAERQQQTASTGQKKFHIVAGSFKKRENAVNYRDKLREQGFDAELIGERDGMHAVSYASFTKKAEATKEMNRIKNEEGLQAWLLYY